MSATEQKLREALHDAVTSLETISRLAGKAVYQNGDFTHLGTFADVRGYATSRACVARQALALPTADHIPNAGEMVNGLTQAETDASASVSGLTATPVGEREAFENEMRHVDVWGHRSLKKRASGNYENWQVNLMWDVWQARAALSAGDAVDGLPGMEPVGEVAQFSDDLDGHLRGYLYNPLPVGTKLYTAAQIDASMRKGQLWAQTENCWSWRLRLRGLNLLP